MKKLLCFILAVEILLFSGCADDGEPEAAPPSSSPERAATLQNRDLRAYHTEKRGGGDDVNTVMFYCIGSDLESDGGNASIDIEEILAADLGENVNFVIQTGGAYSWSNPMISSKSCQRFIVEDGELVELEDIGMQNMADPASVRDFISFAAQEYPADRYDLIFWNHGGGTMAGFGFDEHFPDSTLTLAQIGQALDQAGVRFDFVGFDACLMGTIETAYMLEPYADYLIASEEMEAGTGWYYTNWLDTLGEDPSIDTVSLAKTIIDDFVEDGPDASWLDDSQLSIVDLREIPALYDVLCSFMDNSLVVLENRGFSAIAEARGRTKDFGEGDFDQIDLIDYLDRVDIEGAQDLKDAVGSAVKYYNSNISGANGLAMYYPYGAPEYYEETAAVTSACGFGGSCDTFFQSFANALAYGDMNFGMSSAGGILTGSQVSNTDFDYAQCGWFDADLASEYSEDFYGGMETSGYDELVLTDKGDYFALEMTEDDWDFILGIEQQVYVDDGEGYIELGSDNVYESDEDGDLIVDYDYLWVAIDGTIVPFYAEDEVIRTDQSWFSYGYVPAVLNGKTDIQILLQWDSEHTNGYVLGYRAVSTGVAPAVKGALAFAPGDVVQPICDYYLYDGSYDDSYLFGDAFAISMDSEVTYEDIGDEKVEVTFMLTDIYQNTFWTETVVME